MLFFYMGFEHSIVNMFLFPSGLLLGADFTLMDYLIWNEIPTVIGNLVADPELRYAAGGDPVANFTVASTPRTFDRQSNEWKDGEAMFLRVSLWKDAALNAAESLTKGMRVIVSGGLVSRAFEDREGNKRSSYELDVDEIGPSLQWATAQETRASRGGGFGGATPDPRAGQQQSAPAQDPWSGGGQQGGGWDTPNQSEAVPF